MEKLCLTSWLPEQLEVWREQPRAADMVLPLQEAEPCGVRAQRALLGEPLRIPVDSAHKDSATGVPIEITLDREDGALRILVSDPGWGISADETPLCYAVLPG
jgi:hypothetical protein